MSQIITLPLLTAPLTTAVRNALAGRRDQGALSDLLFLERWELAPIPGAAAALRVSQIRRANPTLAAAVRAEIAAAARATAPQAQPRVLGA
jgi:hypothetical protein